MVKEELHGSMADISLRSRSAAKARQARMSSCVRSGKSSRISCSDMPEARYSSTSYTVMRMPRMQGFPPRLPGSIEILSWSFIAKTSSLFAMHLFQCLHLQHNASLQLLPEAGARNERTL